MFQIQSITEEFLNPRCSYNDAWWVGEFENIESEEESLAKRCQKTIIWWGGEGQDVDSGRWGSADNGARGFVRGWRGENWECEESLSCHFA